MTDLEKVALELMQMTLLALFVADWKPAFGAFVRSAGGGLQFTKALQTSDGTFRVRSHDGRFLGQDQL